MLIARILVSSLYALLMIIAAFAQFRQTKKLDFLMICGALLLITANFLGAWASLIIATSGLLVIHCAALLNGKKNGKINVSHHLVRFAVSSVIFLLFLFSR